MLAIGFVIADEKSNVKATFNALLVGVRQTTVLVLDLHAKFFMNAEFQNSVADATDDIMSFVSKLNECSCERFKATLLLLETALNSSDLDRDTKLMLGRLVAMFTVVHLAKHSLNRIAAMQSPAEMHAFMSRLAVTDILMEVSCRK